MLAGQLEGETGRECPGDELREKESIRSRLAVGPPDDDQLICGHGRGVGMGEFLRGGIACGRGQALVGGHGRE